MIKLSPFTLPALAVSYFAGFIHEYLLMFFVLFFHEAGHLLAIKKRAVEIESLTILPFGISITVKDDFFRSPTDEIPIAAAGPVMSILTGIAAYFICDVLIPGSRYAIYFSASSIYLGLFNLIPAYPADGGRILAACLSFANGYIKSYNTVMKLTKYISAILIASGIYILVKTHFNFTFCLTGCFLYYGILTEKNHTAKYLKRELYEYKTKSLGKRLPVRRIAADKNIKAIKLVDDLSSGSYCIFEIIEGFRKKKEITEGELLDAMLKKGTNICIKDIYNSTE